MFKKIVSFLGILGLFSQMIVFASISFADVPLSVTSFTLSDDIFDPTEDDLRIDFMLSKEASISLILMDGNRELDTFEQGMKTSGSYDFRGKVDSNYIGPKTYTMKLKATVISPTLEVVYDTETFEVEYNDSDAPDLDDLDVSDSSFAAIDDATTVSFYLDGAAEVKINVLDANDNVVFEPNDFDWDDYEDEDLEFDWDGTDENDDPVDEDDYYVEIIAANSDGAAYELTKKISVTAEGSDYTEGSSKIRNISFDPSNDWNPLDEKLTIEWNTEIDFDNFTIEARKSGKTIEIYDEDDLDQDDGYNIDFEGLDDDEEYIDEGTWKIRFIGEVDGEEYVTEESISVEYDEPSIDDIFVTKSKIDPDKGEGTYFVFKLKDDADVDVDVLRESSKKVSLLEDEEIDGDKWYAVYWDGRDEDGDDFDYDDNFKFRLTAKSTGNEDVSVNETEVIDLATDSTSISKPNVYMDMAVPPIVDGNDSVVIQFDLATAAQVKVGIYDGISTSGNPDNLILPLDRKNAGNVKATWDAEGKGFHSYKITATKIGESSSEEETGKFVVGEVGEVFGGSSGKITPNNNTDCGKFNDVSTAYQHCEAISWVVSRGFFTGYGDGSFKPYNTISRAEVLAVLIRASNIPLYASDGSNLGWKDVNPQGWYVSYLQTSKRLGLLQGYGDGTVKPDSSVNKSEFVKLLYTASGRQIQMCAVNPYRDVYLGDWYSDYVCQSKKDNLFGTGNAYFFPTQAATRGEVAGALYEFLK